MITRRAVLGAMVLPLATPALQAQPAFPARPLRVIVTYPPCTAPGFLDNRFHYAARLKVWSCQAARMASGLRWPFFSISHSAL